VFTKSIRACVHKSTSLNCASFSSQNLDNLRHDISGTQRFRGFECGVRLLDTVAVGLTTGNSSQPRLIQMSATMCNSLSFPISANFCRQTKQFLLISHRWATVTFSGTGVCVYNLCDNVCDAVLHNPTCHNL
jgi:uncharacterized ferredoxin-like protein